MKIYSITDESFKDYGQIIKGFDCKNLKENLDKTPLPGKGTIYVASSHHLEQKEEMDYFCNNVYGGLPVQLGYCNGFNSRLNCLEYHRDSEINFSGSDFILLLARRLEIEKGSIDSDQVKAFLVPKDTLVEIYATTLHYAPVMTDRKKGFKVLVCLPKGTNGIKGKINTVSEEDRYLFAANKWLLAHRDSAEFQDGAIEGIKGKNLDLIDQIK